MKDKIKEEKVRNALRLNKESKRAKEIQAMIDASPVTFQQIELRLAKFKEELLKELKP